MAPGGAVAEQPGAPEPPATETAPRRPRPLLALASDERLARQAQRGDPRAFDLIFRRFEDQLYRFCVGILHEPQDAQDALQNTMVKAMRSLPGERREIRLRPWLYRIAHNEAVELRRRRRPADSLEAPVVDPGAGPVEHAERDQRLERLFEDIGDLPVRQRAALVMREVNGLEFGEIGEALGTSAGAVRQALYEARRGLHEMNAGREMACSAAISRMLSDGERPTVGRRQLRAHLRACPDCRQFQRQIRERHETFAAISPLPAGIAYGALKGTLAGSSSAGAAGLSAAGGAAVKSGGVTGIAKAVGAALAITAAGTVAADRGGLVNLPTGPPHGNHGSKVAARSGDESKAGPVAVGGRNANPAKAAPERRDLPRVVPARHAPVSDRHQAAAETVARSTQPSDQPPAAKPTPAPVSIPVDTPVEPTHRGEQGRNGDPALPAEGTSGGEDASEQAEPASEASETTAAADEETAFEDSQGEEEEEAAGVAEANSGKGKGRAAAPGQVKKQMSEMSGTTP